MRLVWVIIPLVLIGIIEIEQSFAEEFSLSLKVPWGTSDYDTDDSPKKQLANGVKYNEIICDDDKLVIYKTSDGMPACVQNKHAEKFVHRGWGTFGEISLEITTDKEVYSLGKNVTITMKNNGDTTLIFNCQPAFFIFDELENHVELPLGTYMPPCDAIFPFGPNSETTLIWRQMDNDVQVKPGNYTVKTKSYHPWYNSYLTSLTYDDEYVERAFQTTSFQIVNDKHFIKEMTNVVINTDKSEYKLGEEVNITMKNEGTEDVFFKNESLGFTISDETGRHLKYFGTGSYTLEEKGNSKFAPLETMNGTWNQRDSYSLKSLYAPPGTYTITANFIDVQKNPHTAETKFSIIIPDEYYELREKTDPEFVSYFDDAEYVFVGKLTSKIAGDVVPKFFWLNFDVDEYLKYFPASGKPSDLPLNLNITTHEGAWQNCILTEGKTYLIFAVDEYDLRYTRDQHCFWAVEITHYAVEELREISAVLYD